MSDANVMTLAGLNNDIDTNVVASYEKVEAPMEKFTPWDGENHLVRVVSPMMLDKAQVTSYHWVDEVKRKVKCPKVLRKNDQDRFFYDGECIFCDKAKVAKLEMDFKSYRHSLVAQLIVEEQVKDENGKPARQLKFWEPSIKDGYWTQANGFYKSLKKLEQKYGAIGAIWMTVDGDSAMYDEKVTAAEAKKKADIPDDLSYFSPIPYAEGVERFENGGNLPTSTVKPQAERTESKTPPEPDLSDEEIAALPF